MHESNTPINNLPEFQGAIEINQLVDSPLDESQTTNLIRQILGDAGFGGGTISIAVVDDATIHELNRRYLKHDYPTDVLSFVFEESKSSGFIEGEVIVSGETATRVAARFAWTPGDELLLYIIHGTLHLSGMDDSDQQQRAIMRQAEDRYLERAGIRRPVERVPARDGMPS